MTKAFGICGVFFRPQDPATLAKWYRKWLQLPEADGNYVPFQRAELPNNASSVRSPFGKDTEYLGKRLQAKEGGAKIDPNKEDYEYGRFGWFNDPDGNRVELRESPISEDT